MKLIFIIQGEGKGHSMQAAALKEILESHGHELVKVLQGCNVRKIWSPVRNTRMNNTSFFLSPFFIASKNRKGLNLPVTILVNIFLIPLFLFEIIRIGLIIRKINPEIAINFYDMIGGLALLCSGKEIRKFVISHHFFFEHPDFSWPGDRKPEKTLLLIHSFIASFSADRKLALSFTFSENIPEKRLFVLPPLLRKEILKAESLNNGHIHVYTLQPGYYQKLIRYCRGNPEIRVKMFSDFKKMPLTDLPNLEFYPFSTDKFIDSIVTCSRVLCTAGFETPAEAAFLGKPLEVIPSGNHFEQYCNAVDLERAGLSWRKKSLLPFPEINGKCPDNYQVFREWVLQSEKLILLYLDLE